MAVKIRAAIFLAIGAFAIFIYSLVLESEQWVLSQHDYQRITQQQQQDWKCRTQQQQDLTQQQKQDLKCRTQQQQEQKQDLKCRTRPENSTACPAYFRFLHQDLLPWCSTGITQQSVRRAHRLADYKVVIVGGRLFTKHYRRCDMKQMNENRYLFTIWSLLLLLERFPGRVPDVEMLFNCEDYPLVWKMPFVDDPGKTAPVAIFSYCSSPRHYDIPFPDWSFWGWAEANIGPWTETSAELFKQKTDWLEKAPIAYWKGNLRTARARRDLLLCNVSATQDFGVLVHNQNWTEEMANGFRNSDLSKQCNHRFKIYAEGRTWSVSLKYSLACGSMVMYIDSEYYDFFTRGLIPFVHFWPVERSFRPWFWPVRGDTVLCHSIKSGVEWGNNHPSQAQAIGTCGRQFVMCELEINLVYDYMFHLLQAYSTLQMFQPKVPVNSKLRTVDGIMSLASTARMPMLQKTLLDVLSSSRSAPCTM